MIKVQVLLQNDHDIRYDEVEITKEELLQYACNKAKERYIEGHWTKSSADGIKVEVNCS